VTELDVFGEKDKSTQLQFKVAPPNLPPQTFVMEFDTQPQVFAAVGSSERGSMSVSDVEKIGILPGW
jgi:hypothetical protein